MPVGSEGFEPGRLTMARAARAMRKRELAARMERTEGSISKWENIDQVTTPEPGMIPRLSNVLSVERNWFFKPLGRDERPVFYRSLLSELGLLRDRARARLGFVEAIEQALANYVS